VSPGVKSHKEKIPMKLRSSFVLVAFALALFLLPCTADAQTLHATLSNMSFFQQPTWQATGSFDFNPATNVITNVAITLTLPGGFAVSPEFIGDATDSAINLIVDRITGNYYEFDLVAGPNNGQCYGGYPCGTAYVGFRIWTIPTSPGTYTPGHMCGPGGGICGNAPFNSYIWYQCSSGQNCNYSSDDTQSNTLVITPGAKSEGDNTVGQCYCGDPISPATGNVFEQATDYETAGQNKLTFSRSYNSLASGTFATSFGGQWRNNYDRYLSLVNSTTVIADRADGQQVTFALNGSTWVPDSDVDMTLTQAGSTWALTNHDDTVETYTTTYLGNEALLNTIAARNGYTQTLHYNGSNQLTSVTDPYSRSLILAYNSNGTLNTVSTPDSTTLTYGYTAGGSGLNLTSVTYPTSPSSVLTYTYGENGAPANALTGIIDENNNRYATWGYNANGLGVSSQIGSGSNAQVTSVSYNSNGTTTVTNAFGVQDTYSFTTLQGVSKITGISRAAIGTVTAATRSFTYDTNGYLATSTDWNGNQTTYTNNTHGMPTKIVEPTRTTNIAYYTTPQILVHRPKTITTTGLTSTLVYDTSTGNLLTRTDKDTTTQSVPYSTKGQTRTWTYTWNNFLLASVQNPRTDVTAITNYGYGSDGALTSITDALTHVTNITQHTGGGRPLTIVDPNSVTTTLTYDARQRFTSSAVTTSAGVLTTTYTIDPASELTKVTLPDSSFLVYGYDSAHRVTQVTDAQNNYVQYTPDALGDITAINAYNNSAGLRYQHSATFDALGRILTDVGGASQTTTYSNYDNNGNVQTITDPLLNQTTQVFDALNRLTQVTDANTGVTKFAYDTHDRTTKATDANTHATAYVFDGFGDAIQQSSPDSGVTVYYYDGDANVTKKVDALSVTTNYTFDKLDRIATRTYPADSTQNVTYTYDETGTGFGFGIGRLGTLTDAAGHVNLGYDERGNVLSAKRYSSGGTNLSNVYYTYDQAGRLGGITYPSGMTVSYYRDSIGNIWKVTVLPSGSSTQQTVAFASYKPFGPLYSLTYGDNETSSRQFDLDYRMSEVTDATSGATNLMDLVYGLDAANNLKTVTDTVTPANNQTLGYDVLNRLNTASGNYGSYTWTYDKVGNTKTLKIGTVTTTYTTATGSNQLASYKVGTNPVVTVSTNADGNITNIPPANSTTAATFAYNVANRLSSVSGTTLAATFAYDGFGQRYSKINPGSNPITYAYDQNGALLEENNNGAVTDYVYLNGMPLGVFVPGGTNGTLYYVHTDRQATPQLVTNSTQTAVWSTTYQPYGTTPTIISSIVQNLRFPGQNYDLETGFDYNLYRDYMPNLGRYLEADLIGLVGGLNPYSYASDNPGKFTDRWGLTYRYSQTSCARFGLCGNRPSQWGSGGNPTFTAEQLKALADYLERVQQVADAGAAGSALFGQPVAFGIFGGISVCAGQLKDFVKPPNPAQPYLDIAADEIADESGMANRWAVLKFIWPVIKEIFTIHDAQ
jgi:RHS repeat-associated protein